MTGVRLKRRNLIKIVAIVAVLTLILTSCDGREDNSSQGKKTLTVFTMDELVFEPIMEFTNYNPHWRIEIEEGLDDLDNASDGIKKLNAELFSGKGPDIIIMDELNADKYIEAGLLEDITDIVEDTEGVSEKIIDNQRVDGAIYTMPMGFQLIMNSASPELDVSFHNFSDFISSTESKKCRFSEWYPSMAGLWFRTEIGDTVDYNHKITEDELKIFYSNLKELYQYMGRDPYMLHYSFDNFRAVDLPFFRFFDTDRFMINGNEFEEINISRDYIGSLYDIQIAFLFQRDGLMDFSFYEDNEGYGYIPRYIMAINKNARNKEAASECLKFMIGTGQEYMSKAQMFPTNTGYLNMKIKESAGNEVNMEYVEGMSNNEKHKLIKVINNLGKGIVTDTYEIEIVMQGSEEYLLNKENIDIACEKTMNKLNIYYSER